MDFTASPALQATWDCEHITQLPWPCVFINKTVSKVLSLPLPSSCSQAQMRFNLLTCLLYNLYRIQYLQILIVK